MADPGEEHDVSSPLMARGNDPLVVFFFSELKPDIKRTISKPARSILSQLHDKHEPSPK
jgi:hypothetical protein